jgi:integrase
MSPRGRKAWSKSFGPYGARVRVFERSNGVIYAEVTGEHRRSLKHSDREAAIAWAKKVTAKLQLGDAGETDPAPTVGRVFSLYATFATPAKGAKRQKHDKRCKEMWTRVLGARKDLRKLSRRDWDVFLRDRKSGAIDAAGNPVRPEKRQPVRDRTVEVDCHWLQAVLRWAVSWMDERGRYLLRENPARGFKAPRERNPRRPVATDDRYHAIRRKSDRVKMQVTWGEKRQAVRSYLSEILDLVNATGRRVSAVLQLKHDDLLVDVEPDGAVRWPASTDKQGREWTVPLSAPARAAIDRILAERARVGLVSTYLFPSPRNPAKPVSKDLASEWLRRAEELAKLAPLRGSLWHAYRRKWATERKHLPDVDVAAAGGWKDLQSLKSAYQQADEETLLEVVTQSRRLRDVK